MPTKLTADAIWPLNFFYTLFYCYKYIDIKDIEIQIKLVEW